MTSYIQETDSRIIFALPAEIDFFLPVEHANETFGGRRSSQFLPMPVEYSLIRPAWNAIRQTENEAIVVEAGKILLVIQETITPFQHFRFDLGNLPPLRAFNVDDDSVLIEWIFDDFRIGFSIEPDLHESSWYLVSNTNLGEIGASGYLSRINIKMLISWLINFVISHS